MNRLKHTREIDRFILLIFSGKRKINSSNTGAIIHTNKILIPSGNFFSIPDVTSPSDFSIPKNENIIANIKKENNTPKYLDTTNFKSPINPKEFWLSFPFIKK